MNIDKMENLVLDNDILELEGIDSARENIWLHYKDANNNPIPRVTHIIAQNRDQEYLIKWAANIGRNKYDIIGNSGGITGIKAAVKHAVGATAEKTYDIVGKLS